MIFIDVKFTSKSFNGFKYGTIKIEECFGKEGSSEFENYIDKIIAITELKYKCNIDTIFSKKTYSRDEYVKIENEGAYAD